MNKQKVIFWLAFHIFSLILLTHLFLTYHKSYIFLIIGYSSLITARIIDIYRLSCKLNNKWIYPLSLNSFKDVSINLSLLSIVIHVILILIGINIHLSNLIM